MSKKLYIKTYGCQMNVYDSIRMQDLMAPHGYMLTEDINEANLTILNTCHIREKAADKMYSDLGRIKQIKDKRLKNSSDDMLIAVAGCVGQAEGEEIFARAPYVSVVVGPQSYHSLPELVAKVNRKENHHIELDFIEEEKFDKLPDHVSSQGVSAMISIQEGCDKFCTFCVVPYTRGAEFSRQYEKIYREALQAVENGSIELTLLGQNVNAYHGKGIDGEEINLVALIKSLARIDKLQRIRYTTSHPIDMTDELIKLHGEEPKLMPFLHLPIQSGSNKILKAMNRKHTREEYFDIIDKLKESCPNISLSSDFIIGFPGETDEDFADTLELYKKVGFCQSYSFKYSPRPGTPAAVKVQVPEEIKNERLKILQTEIQLSQMNFNKSLIGKVLPVLFDKESKKFSNQYIGKSPFMQSVHVDNLPIEQMGKIVDVLIVGALQSSLAGKLINITN